MGIYHTGHMFECTIVTVNVKNIGNNQKWCVGAEDIVLIDTEGFTYNGIILCSDALPSRVVMDRTPILPKTQINYIELFPCLPPSVEISRLIVNINGQPIDYIINDRNYSDWEKEANVSATPNQNMQDSAQLGHISNHSEYHIDNFQSYSLKMMIEMLYQQIKELKVTIHSRLNNILTSSECVKLENKISNMCYSIDLDLEKVKDSDQFDSLRNDVSNIVNKYKKALNEQQQAKDEKELIAKKIEELLELSPRDFELYIGSLFQHLGYIIEVTPYVNDKGLDIIMEKDGVKYGVQCKRYKGTVGSPDIQTFLGALSHAKADKGFFVTTGMFSFEAEKMAAEHPVQLINRIDLAKLILTALNVK